MESKNKITLSEAIKKAELSSGVKFTPEKKLVLTMAVYLMPLMSKAEEMKREMKRTMKQLKG